MERAKEEEEWLKEDKVMILDKLEEVEKAGGCDCDSKYCFHKMALDLRRTNGIPLEKIAEYTSLVQNYAEELEEVGIDGIHFSGLEILNEGAVARLWRRVLGFVGARR